MHVIDRSVIIDACISENQSMYSKSFTVIMVLVIHKAMIIILWKVWPMLKSIINFPKIVRSSLKKRNIATVYPLIMATVVSTSMLMYTIEY